MPRTCCLLTSFVAGFAGLRLSFWKALVRVCDWEEPHDSEEHERAKVGKATRERMEGAAKERRRRTARAAGEASIFDVGVR